MARRTAKAQEFSSITRIAAPVERVWPIMTDHERYVKWTQAKRVELVVEGSPERNGLGAVRKFFAGPMSPHERVVEFVPPGSAAGGPARMVYVVDQGIPVKNYRSTMELVADGANASVLTWSSTFVPKIVATGGLWRRIMASAVGKFAAGIKADAESGTPIDGR
jgi:hypothetical protein